METIKLIVEIPEELHAKLKHKAIDNKITLRELVNVILEKGIK